MSMKQVKVEKVTLNIGTGGPGDVLDKAQKLLDKLTNHKSVTTKSKRRIPTWNIRPGLEIGCKVTLRGKEAEELITRLLAAKANRLKPSNFDNTGNVSFGISKSTPSKGKTAICSCSCISLRGTIPFGV